MSAVLAKIAMNVVYLRKTEILYPKLNDETT